MSGSYLLYPALAQLGWNVDRAFHVPDMTLAIRAAAALALLVIAWLARNGGNNTVS